MISRGLWEREVIRRGVRVSGWRWIWRKGIIGARVGWIEGRRWRRRRRMMIMRRVRIISKATLELIIVQISIAIIIVRGKENSYQNPSSRRMSPRRTITHPINCPIINNHPNKSHKSNKSNKNHLNNQNNHQPSPTTQNSLSPTPKQPR